MNRMRTFALGLAFLAGVLLVAQGPGRIPMRVMGPDEGMANPLVNCMAQSGDGFVWVGTWSGLFRTEGRHFELVDWSRGGSVTDMAVDAAGDLWVGTERSLAVRRNGRFSVLGPEAGLPAGGAYRKVLATPGGLFLIRDGKGFAASAGDRFEALRDFDLGELQDLAWAPRRGGVLALGARGLVRISDGARLSLPTLGKEDALLQVAEDGEGFLWLLSRQGLWRQDPQHGGWQDRRALLPSGVPFRMVAGVGGGVVLHHPSGARWVHGEVIQIYPRQEFQSAPGVGAALVDREGALWLGAYGVQRTLGAGLWRNYGESEGLPAPGAWAFLKDRRGRFWVGNGKGLCLGTPTGWKVLLPGLQILSVREDARGFLWATGGPQDCVHRIDPDSLAIKTLRLPTTAPSQFREVVSGQDPDQVWVYPRWQVPGWAFHGRSKGGRWSWSPVLDGGQPVQSVNYMAKSPEGRIFLTAPAGIYEVVGSEARLVMARPPEWSPQYIVFSKEGELFLGQNESRTILRFRPEGRGFRPSGRVELPASLGVYLVFSMTVDERGHLWAGTSEGLVRYDLATGQALRWTMGEGMPNNDCNALGILPLANGDTWVSTAGGIGLFLGSQEKPVGTLPAPVVTSVRLQGEALEMEPGPLRLGPRPGTLEFRFQSLHFGLQGRIRHQMRIAGLNPEWEALEDAVVSLRGLGPGTYRLELRSFLPEGLKSPVTTLEFIVAPAWWQTLTARLAGLIALAFLAIAAARYWARHLHRRNLALQRLVAARTDEVARINTELLLAKELSEQANRSKSAFLANMSHELRTPLNAILLYCELLTDSAKASGNEEDLADLLRVRSAGKHLLTLINGLLDLAKIEAGRMNLHLEDIPLADLLEEVLSTLRPIVDQRGNRLVLDASAAPAVLRSDATKLRQILFNLLSNACKFTEDGRILLRVAGDGKRILFEISDTGIGMTPEQVGRIFQDFVQAEEETSRKYGGTGLGLTISRRLTELLGGRINVMSEAGRGTTFLLELPVEVRAPEPQRPESAGQPPSDGGRPKALVLAEDAVVRDFFSRLLAREGFWVATASGAEEGLALARQIHPRLWVVDAELAAAEGWSLLGRMQQDPQLRSAPILLESLSMDGERAFAAFAPELLRFPLQSGALGSLLALPRAGQAAPRVLALCTEEGSEEALGSIAHRHGWTFEATGQADALLALLSLHRPDLVLVDLDGANSEAWILLDELQRRPEWRSLRVVALTLREPDGAGLGPAPLESRRVGGSRETLAAAFPSLLRSRLSEKA